MFWKKLKSLVVNAIKPNNQQQITGQILQDTLNSIISAVGENATFAGIATPDIVPGEPDGPTFYLAVEPGEYINFGNIVLTKGLSIIQWNSQEWKITNLETDILNDIDRLNALAESLKYKQDNASILEGDYFRHRLDDYVIDKNGFLRCKDSMHAVSSTPTLNAYGLYVFKIDIPLESITISITSEGISDESEFAAAVAIGKQRIIIPTSLAHNNKLQNHKLALKQSELGDSCLLYIMSNSLQIPLISREDENGNKCLYPLHNATPKGVVAQNRYYKSDMNIMPMSMTVQLGAYTPGIQTHIPDVEFTTELKLKTAIDSNTGALTTGDDVHSIVYKIICNVENKSNFPEILRIRPTLSAEIHYAIYVDSAFISFERLGKESVIDLSSIKSITQNENNESITIAICIPNYLYETYEIYICAEGYLNMQIGINDSGFLFSAYSFPFIRPTYIDISGYLKTPSVILDKRVPGSDGLMHVNFEQSEDEDIKTALICVDDLTQSYLEVEPFIKLLIKGENERILNSDSGETTYASIWFDDVYHNHLAVIPIKKDLLLPSFIVPFGTKWILYPYGYIGQYVHIAQILECSAEIFRLMQKNEELQNENNKIKIRLNEISPEYVKIRNTISREANIIATAYKGFEWSLDKKSWNSYDESTGLVIPATKHVYLRGKDLPQFTHDNPGIQLDIKNNGFLQFTGDIRTLINYETLPSKIPDFCFSYFIQNGLKTNTRVNLDCSNITQIGTAGLSSAFCETIVNIDLGNVSFVGDSGLSGTFSKCYISDIKISSKLNRIGKGGMNSIFEMASFREQFIAEQIDLSGLKEIPASGLRSAFSLSNIQIAPNLGNVKKLGDGALYQMFNSCKGLEMPANLSKVVVLATDGANHIQQMYTGCNKLKMAVTPNIVGNTSFNGWLSGVASSGDIYKPNNLVLPEGADGIPAGWTVKDLNTYYG